MGKDRGRGDRSGNKTHFKSLFTAHVFGEHSPDITSALPSLGEEGLLAYHDLILRMGQEIFVQF